MDLHGPKKGLHLGRTVTFNQDRTEEKRTLLGNFNGKVKKELTYTLPPDEIYVGYEADDPQKAYTVFAEQIVAGSDMHFSDHRAEANANKYAVTAKAAIPGAEAEISGAYTGESSEKMDQSVQIKTNRTAIKVTVMGGGGCSCSNQATLTIYVLTKKKSESIRPVSLCGMPHIVSEISSHPTDSASSPNAVAAAGENKEDKPRQEIHSPVVTSDTQTTRAHQEPPSPLIARTQKDTREIGTHPAVPFPSPIEKASQGTQTILTSKEIVALFTKKEASS
jgi:hypothetical protein